MGSAKDVIRDPLDFEVGLGKRSRDGGGGGGDATRAAQAAAEAVNAASEREIAELSRQFNISRKDILPFLRAGRSQLGALRRGATAGGLDQRLGEIFNTDIFGSLVDERTRAAEGQLAAGGLARSGTALEEIANIPTSIGLDIENLLTGRSATLAGSGQNAAVGLGALGAQASQGIGASLAQQGQSTASGILGAQQARASLASQQSASQAAATQNTLAAGLGLAAIFFSDPKLKENVEEIGKIIDLKIYEWDWIPEARGTMIEKCGTIGFMADEVEELYPHHVYEYCGLMTIDYPALLSELETKNMARA